MSQIIDRTQAFEFTNNSLKKMGIHIAERLEIGMFSYVELMKLS